MAEREATIDLYILCLTNETRKIKLGHYRPVLTLLNRQRAPCIWFWNVVYCSWDGGHRLN